MHEVDYYELLSVSPSASATEIRSAYRSLAKVMHPDAGGTAGTFRMLREAFETLTDPESRAEYDRGDAEVEEPADVPVMRPEAAPQPRAARQSRFHTDPDYVPKLPQIDPAWIDWWQQARVNTKVDLLPRPRPDEKAVFGAAGGWLLLLLILIILVDGSAVLAVGLVMFVGPGAAVFWLVRRHLTAKALDTAFTERFGTRAVFGRPGTEDDQVAERLTAELLANYLTRLPGARIFHGLAEPGSVFADLDHAVLCGRRLVLIESKLWLPGQYEVDDSGSLWRNGHPFRGGGVRLPDRIATYRALLPDLDIRGVLLLYPSRPGEISCEPSGPFVSPMTPLQFVTQVGGWLAVEPNTVDRAAFLTLCDLTLTPSDTR